LEIATSFAVKGAIHNRFGIHTSNDPEDDGEEITSSKIPASVDLREEIKEGLADKAPTPRKPREKKEAAVKEEVKTEYEPKKVTDVVPRMEEPKTEVPRIEEPPKTATPTPTAKAITGKTLTTFNALQREAVGLRVELPKEAKEEWKSIKSDITDGKPCEERARAWIDKWEPMVAQKRLEQ
jgi:hypothetical protein